MVVLIYEDYEINLPENTEGNLLLYIYGWKSFTVDMGIGKIELLYSDQYTLKILYFSLVLMNQFFKW